MSVAGCRRLAGWLVCGWLVFCLLLFVVEGGGWLAVCVKWSPFKPQTTNQQPAYHNPTHTSYIDDCCWLLPVWLMGWPWIVAGCCLCGLMVVGGWLVCGLQMLVWCCWLVGDLSGAPHTNRLPQFQPHTNSNRPTSQPQTNQPANRRQQTTIMGRCCFVLVVCLALMVGGWWLAGLWFEVGAPNTDHQPPNNRKPTSANNTPASLHPRPSQ